MGSTVQLKRLAVLALGTALLACPTLTPPGAVQVRASGTWEHPASGLRFPEQIGGYRRVVINQYNPAGTDVGVGYNHEAHHAWVAFTVFVRPPLTLESGAQASLSEQFGIEREVIRTHHAGARESWVREESFVTENGPVRTKAAEFRYTEAFAYRRQPVVSQLYLFERDGWFVKYRLTFAERQEEQAREVARRMMRSAPWGRRAARRGVSRLQPESGSARRSRATSMIPTSGDRDGVGSASS